MKILIGTKKKDNKTKIINNNLNGKGTRDMKYLKRILSFLLAAILLTGIMSGCTQEVKLDPDNPITITIWHYYNGVVLNAFEAAIKEFNETIGTEKGIIVESSGIGSVGDLENAVMASANNEIGSMKMPNIFAAYADTAYRAEQLGLLADLEEYFSKKEQGEYLDSYIEEGRIGLHGELRIFPVAKATEVMIINETDWLPFAEANGLSYDSLNTMEGLANTSRLYYNWTAEETGVGKSFFGRDGMANLFITASKEFGTEIFNVKEGKAKIDINKDVMRKIWDSYYVPYISGYFSSYGRFRSDDAKVGDILGYVGSTSSALYFPTEVTTDDAVYPIGAKVLPAPLFEGGTKIMVQQGAGMVVVKSTAEEEYASLLFLKWFTEVDNNIIFSSISGYMPVKKEAINYDIIKSKAVEAEIAFTAITDETLRIAIDGVNTSGLYTNKAFTGGVEARAILENHLQDKAAADREAVVGLIDNGTAHEQAVAQFNTDENFNNWLEDFTNQLNEAAKQ